MPKMPSQRGYARNLAIGSHETPHTNETAYASGSAPFQFPLECGDARGQIAF
jgi:hypothetical protein